MAKGKNDNGGNSGGQQGNGLSVLVPSEVQDAVRRAKKAHQRGRHGQIGTSNLFAEIQADRAEMRAERETTSRLRVARGAASSFGKAAWYKGWSDESVLAATRYIESLAGLGDDAFDPEAMPSGLTEQQVFAARRYYAGGIVRIKYPPRNTPGQLASWFACTLETAQAAFERPRAEPATVAA